MARSPASRARRTSPARPSPGVQIFSRAAACSSGIGFAESATTSIALRARTSSRTSSSPARRLQPVQDLLRASSPRAAPSARAPRGSPRRTPRCPRPRRSRRRPPRAAAAARRRAVPRRAGPPRCARRSAGTRPCRCPGGRASAACGPRARWRAPRRAHRARRRSRRRRPRRARPRGTRRRCGRSSTSRRRVADVLAQLGDRVEARLLGELVVDLGQLLGLDLLDRDGELGVLAREVLGAVVVGEGHLRRRRPRRRVAPLSWSSKPGMRRPGAELDELVAPLAAGEGLAVDRADVVHGEEVALLGLALDDVEARERGRAAPSISRSIASSSACGSRTADLEVAGRRRAAPSGARRPRWRR